MMFGLCESLDINTFTWRRFTVGRHDSFLPDVATHYQILKNTNYKWFFLCF